MKEAIKMVVTHFFVICVAMLFFTSVGNLLEGVTALPIVYPFQVMITGVLTSVPSLLFHFKNEPSKKQFHLRFFIHFCIIEAIVMTEGALVGWYSDFINALVVFAIVMLVYAVVLLYSHFVDSDTANNINKALDRFHEENEE